LLMALAGSNVVTYLAFRRPAVVNYQTDSLAIDAMSRSEGPFVLMIGDSITERSKLAADVCGVRLIKVGIGGSRASSFIPFAEEMNAKNLVPSLIVIALGLNDANHIYRSDFRTSYNLLIDSLPKVPLILATLTPVEDERMDRASAVDTIIRNTAAERGLNLIDLGVLKEFKTTDGIHLTDRAYTSWSEKIVSGIRAAVCGRVSQARP